MRIYRECLFWVKVDKIPRQKFENQLNVIKRGVNRGMQIRRSGPFFRQICRFDKIFVQILNLIRKQNFCLHGVKVHVNGTVNLFQKNVIREGHDNKPVKRAGSCVKPNS